MDGTITNKHLAMGAVDVVRIVKDETTTGSFLFNEVNTGTGSIDINIEMNMGEPLTVTLTGQEDSLAESEYDSQTSRTYHLMHDRSKSR